MPRKLLPYIKTVFMIIIPSVIESVTTVETVSAGQGCGTVGRSYRKSDFIKHFNIFLCQMKM